MEETFEIPYGVTTISSYAFSDIDSILIRDIIIPSSVTTIEDYAFWSSEWISSVTIPDSLTYIGKNAFYGCTSLTIYCEAANKPNGWDSKWNPSNRPVIWDCKNKQ